MRLFRIVLILTALMSLLSGCVVYSLSPFYTEDKVIEYPSVVGKWECVEGCDGRLKLGKNWQLNEISILVVDEEGGRTELDATYFRVGETVFLDTTISEINDGDLAKLHLIPSHFLTKVEMDEEKETLTLTVLEDRMFRNTNDELPFHSIDEDFISEHSRVYIATPEQWVAFLEKHHDSKDIYSDSYSIVLKRKKTAPLAALNASEGFYTLKAIRYYSTFLALYLVAENGKEIEERYDGMRFKIYENGMKVGEVTAWQRWFENRLKYPAVGETIEVEKFNYEVNELSVLKGNVNNVEYRTLKFVEPPGRENP